MSAIFYLLDIWYTLIYENHCILLAEIVTPSHSYSAPIYLFYFFSFLNNFLALCILFYFARYPIPSLLSYLCFPFPFFFPLFFFLFSSSPISLLIPSISSLFCMLSCWWQLLLAMKIINYLCCHFKE